MANTSPTMAPVMDSWSRLASRTLLPPSLLPPPKHGPQSPKIQVSATHRKSAPNE